MKIQIVDSDDRVIGVKERLQLDHAVDIYRVSALWLTNTKGQVLLAQRALTKDKDPGVWGPAVAGTIDEGETYDDNIYKEALEEIGLSGERFTKGPKMHFLQPRNHFCQWYFVTLDRSIDSFVLQDEEVDALEWVDVAQLKQSLALNPNSYVPAMPQIIRELGL